MLPVRASWLGSDGVGALPRATLASSIPRRESDAAGTGRASVCGTSTPAGSLLAGPGCPCRGQVPPLPHRAGPS